MHAILQGNPGLALQLVEMGADLGLRDKDSKTALLYAAEKLAEVVTRPPSLPPSLGALGPAWVYPCCHSEPSPPPPTLSGSVLPPKGVSACRGMASGVPVVQASHPSPLTQSTAETDYFAVMDALLSHNADPNAQVTHCACDLVG